MRYGFRRGLLGLARRCAWFRIVSTLTAAQLSHSTASGWVHVGLGHVGGSVELAVRCDVVCTPHSLPLLSGSRLRLSYRPTVEVATPHTPTPGPLLAPHFPNPVAPVAQLSLKRSDVKLLRTRSLSARPQQGVVRPCPVRGARSFGRTGRLVQSPGSAATDAAARIRRVARWRSPLPRCSSLFAVVTPALDLVTPPQSQLQFRNYGDAGGAKETSTLTRAALPRSGGRRRGTPHRAEGHVPLSAPVKVRRTPSPGPWCVQHPVMKRNVEQPLNFGIWRVWCVVDRTQPSTRASMGQMTDGPRGAYKITV